MKIWRER